MDFASEIPAPSAMVQQPPGSGFVFNPNSATAGSDGSNFFPNYQNQILCNDNRQHPDFYPGGGSCPVHLYPPEDPSCNMCLGIVCVCHMRLEQQMSRNHIHNPNCQCNTCLEQHPRSSHPAFDHGLNNLRTYQYQPDNHYINQQSNNLQPYSNGYDYPMYPQDEQDWLNHPFPIQLTDNISQMLRDPSVSNSGQGPLVSDQMNSHLSSDGNFESALPRITPYTADDAQMHYSMPDVSALPTPKILRKRFEKCLISGSDGDSKSDGDSNSDSNSDID